MEKNKISETITAVVDKKKPGRPRKSANISTIELDGIVDKPIGQGRAIEAVYHNSNCLKKIVSLYRSYTCATVNIAFTKTHIHWYARDHHEKVHCYADINANNITTYYCSAPITFSVTRENLERVFNILNKASTSVSIVLEQNTRSQLLLIIHNADYDTTEKFDIRVAECHASVIPPKPDTSNYPIKFKLSSKHFKERLGNINKFSTNTISFEKDRGDSAFQIVCKDEQVTWSGIFNDPAKIEFESKLSENEFFIVSVNVSNLYSLSNNNFGNDFVITADRYKKLSFVTVLDERNSVDPTTVVSVFVDIVNFSAFDASMRNDKK
jgi:hypothetical protein